MKKNNKVDIDELFREGLNTEHDPVVFPESDWAKLEDRLVQHDKRKRVLFWLRPMSGIAASLLLALAIWMLWPTQQHPSSKPMVAQEEEQPVSKTPEKSTDKNEKAEEVPQKEFRKSPSTAAQEPTQTILSHPVAVQRPPEPVSPADDTLFIAGLKVSSKIPLVRSSLSQPITTRLKPIASLHPTVKKQAEPENVRLSSPTRKHPVVLSLLVAPSYNEVDNLASGKLGSDVGLMVSFGLAKKWSLSTGAIYAKKLYGASGENYSAYSSNQPYGKVDADCRVLDIPVNVNYQLFQAKNTVVSLGTGISSYIMLKENYSFIYSDQYQHDVEVINKNQHWLSVFNLQANIERKLSSTISVSFQPYLKLPMKDVGYAKVRLQSFGLALIANWNL